MTTATIAALVLTAGAAARTITVVRPGQPHDGISRFATVSDAIAAATDGDVIQIRGGRFPASVSTGGRSIELRGAEGGKTVLVPAQPGQPTLTVPESGQGRVVLRNLRFSEGNAENGGALYAAGSVTVENCTFDANRAVRGGAAFIVGDAEFIDCVFQNNTAAIGGAVFAGMFGGTQFSGCVLESNEADRGGAIYAGPSCEPGAAVTLLGSTVEGNRSRSGAGVAADAAVIIVDGSHVSGNFAHDRGAGIDLLSSVATVWGGSIYANRTRGDGAAIGVRDGADLLLRDVEVTANRGRSGAAVGASDDGRMDVGSSTFAASAGANLAGDMRDGGGNMMYPAVPSDLAEPHGALDILDVLDFVSALGSQQAVADFDLDERITVFDLLEFFTDYNANLGV